MNTRNELLCIWSAVLFVVVFTIGLWPLAHFLPAHAPTASAEDIAALYQARPWQMRLGLFVMMGCSGLVCAFVAAITVAMKRKGDDAAGVFRDFSSLTRQRDDVSRSSVTMTSLRRPFVSLEKTSEQVLVRKHGEDGNFNFLI